MSDTRSVVDMRGVRHVLTGLLGRGGQGEVYAVKGGRLAVKLLAANGPAARERIRNQLAHVRRLRLEGLPLAKPQEMLRPPHAGYVMELLTGMVPLGRLIASSRGEPTGAEWYLRTGGLRRRLLVLGRSARALAHLHGMGLAYSDPSPANIFLSDDPAFHEVRFIDTDNIRYESSPGSHSGVFTPGYGAPELVRGRSGVTTLADAYAFAVLAFQTLTLAHPFIGDWVHDGEPELEEQAFAGFLPWIDAADDDRNRASFGVPRDRVLSRRLNETFEAAFGVGRENPLMRPGVAEWAERLFVAADALVDCGECGAAIYMNQPDCGWCGAPRPSFARLSFLLWDPSVGGAGGFVRRPKDGVARPTVLAHTAIAEGTTRVVTRRLAFDSHGLDAEEPVLELSLTGDMLKLRSVNGASYVLVTPSKRKEIPVTDALCEFRLRQREPSPCLHFAALSQLHRVVQFEIRPGGRP